MCEIAVVDPERYSTDELTRASMNVYRAMRSSLGLVAVHGGDGRFDYDVFKRVDPGREAVRSFIEDHCGGAFRLIIHGRMATHGGITREHAHPLEIDCGECDVDYLLHNGVVRDYRQLRDRHQSWGHEYATEVDSEVIAHEYGEVPADVDARDAAQFRQPCYILLSADQMFVYSNLVYEMTEDFRLAMSRRDFGPEGIEDNYVRVTVSPGN